MHRAAAGALLAAGILLAPTVARSQVERADRGGDDSLACAVQGQALAIHRFLLSHKHGHPYTPDERPLAPADLVRLVIVPQALGYLDLYQLTGKDLYRKEAQDRLDAIVRLGPTALGRGPDDGMVAYALLSAGRSFSVASYRDYGVTIAEACTSYSDLKLNWGLMTAMGLGQACAVTRRPELLAKLREITAATASKQFANGSFPHSTLTQPSAHYTGWMVNELLLVRDDDPENPDTDAPLLRARPFLLDRVRPDGSLDYEDEDGVYWRDTYDTRYWINALSDVALDLYALGDREAAQRVLAFLFRQALSGPSAGSYPDKWANVDPHDPIQSGRPSVLRTSLVFWDLTMLLLDSRRTTCTAGESVPCAIRPGDCNAAFAQLGACEDGGAGTNVCINGRWTHCIDPGRITYGTMRCPKATVDCRDYPPCGYVCYALGPQKCIGEHCADRCTDESALTSCDERCGPDDVPPECRAAAAAGLASGATTPPPDAHALAGPVRPPAFGFDPRQANPLVASFQVACLMDAPGRVQLELFDPSGRRVLARQRTVAIPGRIVFDLEPARSLPAGIYFLRISDGERMRSRSIVLAR